MSASGLLDLFSSQSNDASRVQGLAVALVTNNKDPDNQGRVKLKFPWLGDNHESDWARIAVPMAGDDRGTYFLPEVNDEVLVAFQHGSIDSPIVVGALWNGRDRPPANNSNGKNDLRVIRSRSGHEVRLNDADGSETIEIIDKTGGNKIVIASSDNSITIKCAGKLTIDALEVEIKAQSSVKATANSTMDLEASGPASLKGAIVNIN
jgi:uncharacterized protein involved in type VI secretion and phage assembly